MVIKWSHMSCIDWWWLRLRMISWLNHVQVTCLSEWSVVETLLEPKEYPYYKKERKRHKLYMHRPLKPSHYFWDSENCLHLPQCFFISLGLCKLIPCNCLYAVLLLLSFLFHFFFSSLSQEKRMYYNISPAWDCLICSQYCVPSFLSSGKNITIFMVCYLIYISFWVILGAWCIVIIMFFLLE